MAQSTITHLERRRIEAEALVPMLEAFQQAVGTEQANRIAQAVITGQARKDGERWAAQFGNDLAALETVVRLWAEGGSLELESLRGSSEALEFRVVRCRYAEYFRELGLPELGGIFHCSRDFAMIDGFNPKLQLTRRHTIMEGAAFCDFRFEAVAE